MKVIKPQQTDGIQPTDYGLINNKILICIVQTKPLLVFTCSRAIVSKNKQSIVSLLSFVVESCVLFEQRIDLKKIYIQQCL